MRLIYNDDEAAEAAAELKAMGGAAIRLMHEVAEHQEIRRAKISDAAMKLENAGFVRITSDQYYSDRPHIILSCLSGEEALEELDDLNDKAKG